MGGSCRRKLRVENNCEGFLAIWRKISYTKLEKINVNTSTGYKNVVSFLEIFHHWYGNVHNFKVIRNAVSRIFRGKISNPAAESFSDSKNTNHQVFFVAYFPLYWEQRFKERSVIPYLVNIEKLFLENIQSCSYLVAPGGLNFCNQTVRHTYSLHWYLFS